MNTLIIQSYPQGWKEGILDLQKEILHGFSEQ